MIGTYDQVEDDTATPAQAVNEPEANRSGWGWCSLGAIVGLSGGLIAVAVGSLLTAISWFTATEGGGSSVRTLGAILLFASIPLLIAGAHCLDLRETSPKERKKS
jgi:hypothetical protein